ncbi:TetR/AcrR family transcriptional regulator [Erythrobacter sp. GH1-10]|uniref:TetR/AcrR family transcriptional regulator n=1 Tax=Erythrobacter sp. GH1-10 TaxID=3349334 RepID=UPI00387798A8
MATSRLQTTDRADKRELILRTAALHFNERGFNDTRLEDVAAELDTAKTSISYHFKSKKALLEAAYIETCDVYTGLLADASQDATGLGRIIRWVELLGATHSQILVGKAGRIALLNDMLAFEQDAAEEIAARIGMHFAKIEAFINEGCADGSISTPEERGSAYFVWNLANWIEGWLAAMPFHRHQAAISGLVRLVSLGLATDRSAELVTGTPQSESDSDTALFNREARARLKRDAFERAGIRSFNRTGYSNFSLNALTSELGASRGSFYYSFEDKDELLEKCVSRSLRQMSQSLDQAAETRRSAIEKLQLICTSLYTGHFSDLDPLLRPCLFASLSPGKQAVAEAEMQNIAAKLARLVAECFEDESGSSHGTDKLELVLLGSLLSMATSRHITLPGDGGRLKPPPAGAYFRTVFRGLAPIDEEDAITSIAGRG